MMKKFLFLIMYSLLAQSLIAQEFSVSYKKSAFNKPFSGNVLLYLSKELQNPKNVFVGADLTPVFRLEVKDLQPGEAVLFDDSAFSYPVSLSDIERGEYFVQAVFDRNLGGRTIGKSPGNLYSQTQKFVLSKDYGKKYSILCDKIVQAPEFHGTKYHHEIKAYSQQLSEFYGYDVSINAAVDVPGEYFDNDKTYPVVFVIFGFGGDYREPLRGDGITMLDGKPCITVYMDGNCPEGHSEYANSDINGPWGDAIIQDFIPALEKKYRTNGARFITGHSSGGWSSLWLQITNPEVFYGCWSSAPDQVDFRNYQNKNLYEDTNFFYNEDGSLAADITLAGIMPFVKSRDTYQMEDVVCRGEQIHSFDAVFGSFDENGDILRLVDPASGDVNQSAIPIWRRYDISLLLRENWDDYKEAIDGKILITVGDQDNFYLNKAVHLLDQEMKNLGSNMQFRYFPGDHFTVHFDPEYNAAGQAFLDRRYQQWLEENKEKSVYP